MSDKHKTCTTCVHAGTTDPRCYDCKLGRGNTGELLWQYSELYDKAIELDELKAAEESAKKAEQEHDLAIWWEAYRAALGGYDVARILSSFEDAKHSATSPKLIADHALSDYRAKREELLK